jgi:hypothetical protein
VLRSLSVIDGKNKSFEHFENCATAKMTLRKRGGLSRKAAIMSTDPERIYDGQLRMNTPTIGLI